VPKNFHPNADHPTTQMAPCARCHSSQHTTADCKVPFHKTFCSICNKSHPYVVLCPMVREVERSKKQGEYETKHAEYLNHKKAAEEKKSARQMRPRNDVSDTVSVNSFSSSVSTAASLALSLDEEREARKMEKKLRDIAHLEELRAQGKVLDKNQVAKIDGKAKIESSVVMLKVRANAVRPILPLVVAAAVAPLASAPA